MKGIRTRKRAATVVVIVVVMAVIAAVISLQPHAQNINAVSNSKSIPFTWTLRSNSTAHITGSVTSYFQAPNDNATNSTLYFNALLFFASQTSTGKKFDCLTVLHSDITCAVRSPLMS